MEHNVEPVPGGVRCPGENEIATRTGNVFRALDSGTVRVAIRAAEGSLFVDSCVICYSPICLVVQLAFIFVHLKNYATCYCHIYISRVAG